jgi:photosystem II stability/assembly factor-like uncharacterized protein
VDEKLIHSLDTFVYVQFGDGTEIFYLGDCTVLPTLPSPSPDRRPVYSSIGARDYNQIGFEPGPPAATNLTITVYVREAAHYLERAKEANCPFNLYVLQARKGTARSFDNYERAWAYRDCTFTDDPIENAVETEADTLTMHSFNVTARNGRVDHRPVTITRISTIGTADLNGLGICAPNCATDCSEALGACEQFAMGADTVGGAAPDVYSTTDGGDNITISASGFQAGSGITAVSCVPTPDGRRVFLARESVTGLAAQVETALWGGSWVDTVVGETPGDGTPKDTSLFFLDRRHGWMCSNDGRVYFYNGVDWTEQDSAATASGGDQLIAIHFADALVGYAVGDNDTILSTTDGGKTWTDNPSGLGEDWLALHVFDRQRLIMGNYSIAGSGGNLFMSYDAATTWTDVTRWAVVTGVTVGYDVRFLPDGLTGYAIKSVVASAGNIYKSINGGYNWRLIETPTSNFLKALAVCQPNLGVVVGDAQGGTSFIAKISG